MRLGNSSDTECDPSGAGILKETIMAKEEKKKVKSIEDIEASLQDNLDNFPEATEDDPYLVDAKSFLTQSLTCVKKQIKTNV